MTQRSHEGPLGARISDGLARATLEAIMDADVLGVALLRGPVHTHVTCNARYRALSSSRDELVGRPISEAWPMSCAPPELLARVSRTGRSATLREVASGRSVATPSQVGVPSWVTMTYYRVADGDEHSLLVLAEDVTPRVLARERAELLQSLVDDLLATADARAAVAAVVQRTRDALGATAASLFIVDHARAELRGTVADWDWTRTSFTARLSDWPTVAEALESDEPKRMTAIDARGGEAGWFEERGIASSICVPLCHGGRQLAVLFFDFPASRDPLDRAASTFLADVAKRCALALDRPLREAAPLP